MTSPLRERYLSDTVSTAAPGRLLVMLYERLVLDMSKAEHALADGDTKLASERLLHAQDIVLELNASLDPTAWAGAAGLSQIYGFLLSELIAANVNRDAAKVTVCRELVEPLLDAWRQAAANAQEPAPSRAG